MIRHFAHYLLWFAKCQLLGSKVPLELVFNITSRCNLRCKHCAVLNSYPKPMDVPYGVIVAHLKKYRKKGTRVLWLSGGEPLLWQGIDSEGNKRDLEELINVAREMGYFKTILITNGTLPINTTANAVWISIDGLAERHDAVRGEGVFNRLMTNVANSNHRETYANMTINSINYHDVEALTYTLSKRGFKGISFNFHTPFGNTSELMLKQSEREKVVDKIIELKQKGYPIVNSRSGMQRMKEPDWRGKCVYWTATFLQPDGTIIDGCPGWFEKGICEQCGFGMGRELYGISHLRPGSILEAVKVFRSGTA